MFRVCRFVLSFFVSEVFAGAKVKLLCSEVFGGAKVKLLCSEVFADAKVKLLCSEVFGGEKVKKHIMPFTVKDKSIRFKDSEGFPKKERQLQV